MKTLITFLFLIFFTSHFTYSQWVEQNYGASYSLGVLSVVNDNVIWIGCLNRYVYLSTNGGLNWNQALNTNNTMDYIYSVFAINIDTVLVSYGEGDGSTIQKTTNSGLNWSVSLPYCNDIITSIVMNSPLTGIAIGTYTNSTRWSIYKTLNGGITWDTSGLYLSKQTDEISFNNGLMAIGSNLWFASNKNKVYHSTDFGSTWQIQNPFWSSTQTHNRYVWFNDLNNGMTNVENNTSYTTNGGLSWQSTGQQLTGNFIGGIMGTGSRFWATIDKYIYSTTNLGTNWILEYTAPDIYSYNYIAKSRTGTCAWATRNNGGISKGTNIIGIQPISTNVPKSYQLYQNYPNPFNPSTKIKFDVAEDRGQKSEVRLVVYDVLGREVATLVNQSLQPGTYEVEWNGSDFSSGVYFYKLIISDPETSSGLYFTETKKLMLVR